MTCLLSLGDAWQNDLAIIFLEQIPLTSCPETSFVLSDLLNDYQPNYPSPPHRWPGGMRAALKCAASVRMQGVLDNFVFAILGVVALLGSVRIPPGSPL